MYTKKVIDMFQNPQHAGEMENADAVGEIGNVRCGDIIRFNLRIEDDVIKDITFQTYGCVAAIAASEMTCNVAIGKTLDQAYNLTKKQVLEELGEVPLIKHHCASMGIQSLRKAIDEYRKKSAQ
ncbi:MAG: iron-sulfur cluster assembly scaffold protein [Nanoarchaeota archaeon]